VGEKFNGGVKLSNETTRKRVRWGRRFVVVEWDMERDVMRTRIRMELMMRSYGADYICLLSALGQGMKLQHLAPVGGLQPGRAGCYADRNRLAYNRL
jgi:hypothetical protein